MTISFVFSIVDPDHKRSFKNGTSSDVATLQETFPDFIVSTTEIKILRAMHRATGLKESLWSEIADTLERLRGDDCDREIKLEIGTRW